MRVETHARRAERQLDNIFFKCEEAFMGPIDATIVSPFNHRAILIFSSRNVVFSSVPRKTVVCFLCFTTKSTSMRSSFYLLPSQRWDKFLRSVMMSWGSWRLKWPMGHQKKTARKAPLPLARRWCPKCEMTPSRDPQTWGGMNKFRCLSSLIPEIHSQ